MANKTIELNGKLYDATTGLAVKTPTPKPVKPRVPSPRKVIVKSPHKINVVQAKPIKPATTKKPTKKPAHKPAPSKTLNRQAVKKPTVRPKPTPSRPITPVRPVAPPRIAVRPTPIAARGARRPVQQRPISRQAMPTVQPIVNPAPIAKTPEQKRKNKLISITISGIVVLLVALAILLYFFVPAVSLWVAASRADVRASLPTYAPLDYGVTGTIESSPGLVNINYHSASSDSNYSISMANSNWDSEGVLENKVKPVSNNFQTLQQKGLTIFRYKDHAIWVNGGILYTITDGNKLTNEQILKIVDGI